MLRAVEMLAAGIVNRTLLSLRGVKYCVEKDIIAYGSGMEKTKWQWHCNAQVRSSAFLDSQSFLVLCPPV